MNQCKIQNSKCKMDGSEGAAGSQGGGLDAGGVPPEGGTTNGTKGHVDREIMREAGEVKELGATFSEECWAIWKKLRASRRAPEFSRETWAAEYGFANYRRMYRAVRVLYGMTPLQLEM